MARRSRSELLAAVAEEERALAELRALLRRVDLNELEASDGPKLKALLAKYIHEAEAAGQDDVIMDLDLVHRDPQA